MPLISSSLAQSLESVFNGKPPAADAPMQWANAYQSYAQSAMSTATSLPVTAPANFGLLLTAFQGGLAGLAPMAAASVIAQGVMSYWQAMVWAGPLAAGTTVFPGNVGLAAALAAVFSDLGKKTNSEKANDLASAFDAGAKLVIVSDIPIIQPAPPIVGPIM